MDKQGAGRKTGAARGFRLHARDPRQRERKVSSAWTCEEDALKALSARQQQIRAGQTDRPTDVTFGHVVERYLKFKSDHGKRPLGGRVSWVRRKLSGSCWPVRSPATSIW